MWGYQRLFWPQSLLVSSTPYESWQWRQWITKSWGNQIMGLSTMRGPRKLEDENSRQVAQFRSFYNCMHFIIMTYIQTCVAVFWYRNNIKFCSLEYITSINRPLNSAVWHRRVHFKQNTNVYVNSWEFLELYKNSFVHSTPFCLPPKKQNHIHTQLAELKLESLHNY